MWFGYVPRWMLPGTTGAKLSFAMSTVVAVVIVALAWASHVSRAFAAVFTVFAAAIVAYNFVTLVLARGPQARRMRTLADGQDRAA